MIKVAAAREVCCCCCRADVCERYRYLRERICVELAYNRRADLCSARGLIGEKAPAREYIARARCGAERALHVSAAVYSSCANTIFSGCLSLSLGKRLPWDTVHSRLRYARSYATPFAVRAPPREKFLSSPLALAPLRAHTYIIPHLSENPPRVYLFFFYFISIFFKTPGAQNTRRTILANFCWINPRSAQEFPRVEDFVFYTLKENSAIVYQLNRIFL